MHDHRDAHDPSGNAHGRGGGARADGTEVVLVFGRCTNHRHEQVAALAQSRGDVSARVAPRTSGGPLERRLADALDAAARDGARPRRVILDLPDDTRPEEAIGALAGPGASEDIAIVGIVTVVDAGRFRADLGDDGYLVEPAGDGHDAHYDAPYNAPHDAHGVDAETYTARALLTVTQIEFASTVILVDWAHIDHAELSILMAVIGHLAPDARMRLARGAKNGRGGSAADTAGTRPRAGRTTGAEAPDHERGGGFGSLLMGARAIDATTQQPGWVRAMNGEHRPHVTDRAVSTFRYQQLRPFHPNRIVRLLDGEIEAGAFGAVVRSAGFCAFATRPGIPARWDHIGRMISFHPMAVSAGSELLAVGQDLVFQGIYLDEPGLIRALDACALTDAEFLAGPALWRRLPDPLPRWEDGAERRL
jgi:G3E family GTPase